MNPVPERNLPSSQKDPESLGYKIAAKLLDEALKKFSDFVFRSNGIPIPLTGAHKQLISIYGKRVFELYNVSVRYDPQLWQIKALSKDLIEDSSIIFSFIKSSPTAPLERLGPAFLFQALLYPHSVSDYSQQRAELRKKAEKLVLEFDGLLTAQEEVFAKIGEVFRESKIFLEIDKPRNVFDSVLGRGAIEIAEKELCYSTKQLYEAYIALINHRDEWAKFLGKKTKRVFPLQNLLDSCPI